MSDQCLYIKKDEIGVIVICLYIDDTLCVGNRNAIEKFKRDITIFFVTKEEGEVTENVGCMIKKNQDTINLHQTDLIKKLRNYLEKKLKIRGTIKLQVY